MEALDDAALARLFTDARTHAAFGPAPLPTAMLQRLYQLASLGPTSQNCQPARFVFVATEAGRDLLSIAQTAALRVMPFQKIPSTMDGTKAEAAIENDAATRNRMPAGRCAAA